MDAIQTYHEQFFELFDKAQKSGIPSQDELAEAVLEQYFEVINASGLSQETYEAFAREQILYELRKKTLIETKFSGDENSFERYLEEYEKHCIVDFGINE